MPTNLHPYSIRLQPTKLMFFTTQNCSFKHIPTPFWIFYIWEMVFFMGVYIFKKGGSGNIQKPPKREWHLVDNCCCEDNHSNQLKKHGVLVVSVNRPWKQSEHLYTSLLLTLCQYVQNLPCPDRLWHSSWELYSLIHPCKSTPQGRLLQCVRHSSRTPELWN